jgi:GH15 family glucan-1,4-alpha-glucosidase
VTARIEDYGLIGDLQTAALVDHRGSIDWLCFPRFDSPACFAALLGDDSHGSWAINPRGAFSTAGRRYRDESLVLETDLQTDGGAVRLIDFMPVRDGRPDVVRIVEGLEGSVDMELDLAIRFDYGSVVPWVRRADGSRVAIAGPDALCLRSPVEIVGRRLRSHAEFTVRAGERVPFTMTWYPSHEARPSPVDPEAALAATERFWREWMRSCRHTGEWGDVLRRSLMVLKALTYEPTGGIVAAPTTSLPEAIGSTRNWDYRYCWLRDATLTLLSFLRAGYHEEATAWRDWFLRAIAGSPDDLQIMYGVAGERRLAELDLAWLPGYEGSRPVRVGNAASGQLQLDVYGEVVDALYQARAGGIHPSDDAWQLTLKLLDWLESGWREQDEGIWEVRGPRRHFTHSKVMAWVAFDRAVRTVEQYSNDGPVDRWRRTRDEIHGEVCAKGFDPRQGAFVQSYGSDRLDASSLMIPLVGFLPATDERMVGTVAAIESELMRDGLVERYRTDAASQAVDGLPPGEGVFLPCSFWLVQVLHLQGRVDDARSLLRRLVGLGNDLGLFAEEYEPDLGRLVGNFPQAFTHLALVDAVLQVEQGQAPRTL